jgi:succinate dehydrogenase / fumarate reductase, cytochrome b subunit
MVNFELSAAVHYARLCPLRRAAKAVKSDANNYREHPPMAQNPNRPISPHLQVYKWGPHMAISIFHRATGFVLATAGMMTLLWWLASIAGGQESYATFQKYVVSAGADATQWEMVGNWFFRLLALGVTFSFFQHLFSGLRHLLMDIGAGYELGTSRNSALFAFIASLTATGVVALFAVSRFLGVFNG